MFGSEPNKSPGDLECDDQHENRLEKQDLQPTSTSSSKYCSLEISKNNMKTSFSAVVDDASHIELTREAIESKFRQAAMSYVSESMKLSRIMKDAIVEIIQNVISATTKSIKEKNERCNFMLDLTKSLLRAMEQTGKYCSKLLIVCLNCVYLFLLFLFSCFGSKKTCYVTNLWVNTIPYWP